MTETSVPKDVRWIMSMLPHRYPMLLVDRVLEIESRQRIVAIKNVTMNEQVLQGHFPDFPLVPGVLLVEGMAQAAGILLLCDKPEEERKRKVLLFTAIDKARFRRPVVPGDQVRYEIEVLRLRSNYSKVEARAMVEDQVAAEATLSSTMIDR